MERRRKPSWPAWIAAVGVLYVLSSGPTRIIGVYETVSPKQPTGLGDLMEGPENLLFIDQHVSPWYQTFYSPLIWASDKPWGAPLAWYWSVF